MKREPTGDPAATEGGEDGDWLAYDCLICTNAIDLFGVFDCGHYTCAICAIRIFKFGKSNTDKCCPMCRSVTKDIKVMTTTPPDEYSFDMDTIRKIPFYAERTLRVSVESKEIIGRLEKLYAFLCPLPECWVDGAQEPFTNFGGLKEHLRTDHSVKYCPLCIDNRPSFLCEQLVYSDKEFDAHNKGKCAKDLHSFSGHPMCLFCGTRFYDGDQLLKHMQQAHFSCDVCNRGEFTFVFYKNRPKLLEHFSSSHKLCNHADCVQLDPMMRVFGSDIELVAHEQRVHGAAVRTVPLESLGFTYGTGRTSGRGHSSSVSPPPSATSAAEPATQNPATGRDVHATSIWFDYITHRDPVDLMPKTKHRTTAVAVKEAAHEVHLASQVIPDHYETPAVRAKLKRLVSRIETPSVAAEPVGSKKEAGSEPVHIPDNLSPEEYNAMLKLKLERFHLDRAKYDLLKKMSGEFLVNKLMATEYYRQLGQVFTRAQLDEVFEPLAYSLTNETKRAALIAARTMLNSAEERQRQEALRKEAEEKAKADLLKAKQTLGGWKAMPPAATAAKESSAAKGAQKAKKSVWAEKSEARLGGSAPVALVAPTTRNQLGFNVPPSLIGETPQAEVPAALLPAATAGSNGPRPARVLRVDPEDFPTLESTMPKGKAPPPPPKSTKKPQQLNAWLARKN